MHRICRLLGLVFFSQIFQRLFEHFIRCFLRLLTSVTMVFFCEAAQCWAHDSKRKNPDFSVRENSAQRTQALAPAGWDSIPEVVVTTRESENYLVSRISRFSYLFRVARIANVKRHMEIERKKTWVRVMYKFCSFKHCVCFRTLNQTS